MAILPTAPSGFPAGRPTGSASGANSKAAKQPKERRAGLRLKQPMRPVERGRYSKPRRLYESATMLCWYFGNYPAPMNKAAADLLFEPFPANEDSRIVRSRRHPFLVPNWPSANCSPWNRSRPPQFSPPELFAAVREQPHKIHPGNVDTILVMNHTNCILRRLLVAACLLT